LWEKFADPKAVLRTYSLPGAVDFILYLFDKQQDDLIWETWLHRKPTKGEGKNEKSLGFEEYKKMAKQNAQIRAINKKAKVPSKEQETEQIKFAGQFIKARKEMKNGDGRSI